MPCHAVTRRARAVTRRVIPQHDTPGPFPVPRLSQCPDLFPQIGYAERVPA
ncbi:hypothetical protein THER5_1895 [Bifidobacterium thermacidophilum subsp. thermacidophilum]|uniref:Uncharacterized protein n=1 Tax=Bifidobacterium thermacidophilum subsp. thermacidophilum TaxID=79262 RepID=A0A087E244_9BIFI|nr:hypothetical protein THER5_1895 [Bifidobacterium thermacidophilum subsp. thermacidophilum]